MPRAIFFFKYVRICTKIVMKAKFLSVFSMHYSERFVLLTNLLIGHKKPCLSCFRDMYFCANERSCHFASEMNIF
jgi:hypothetical protein